ncbi:phosphohistidine phosphatase SixA [Pseudomonas neustonica]|uniref:Phosphohistidine phosphatase SixA n=1 Tax=Pseudomonas neustonica TaxID=2487346 RepID=A0ABX9XE22_9PSED|nr:MULTISPECIES: phosphohistidine phosphatase SixA [Pseudomonas]ROZ80493.1 phosphohistidine phosphatase SixA [Pseudomonas sp. SSM44]ROZ81682.1 phosphohistidine phosphatase SixA [Pseudomonas neustonica]|tara:strand:- start:674 stop:1144 length:471 start_codon:yes stop_codon:yes gene_type:complete
MRLWVLRHGQAAAQAASDAQRPLTGAGEAEVRAMSTLLKGQPLGAILASPYVRAQQTAALMREELGFAQDVGTAPWLTPDDQPGEVIDFLTERTESELLLVSHQPLVSQLVSLLVHGHRAEHYPMPTAALACIDMDFVAAGLGNLVQLSVPADLSR